MKKLLLTLLTLLCLPCIASAAGKDYTLDFITDNYSGKVDNYTSEWKTKSSQGNEYKLNNFSNYNKNWNYVKCGREKYESVAYISTTFPISEFVTQISVTFGAITADYVTYVNSIVVERADNNAFTNAVEVGTITITAADVQTATADLKDPVANSYYRIKFDVQKSTKKNGFVQVNEVKFLTAAPSKQKVALSLRNAVTTKTVGESWSYSELFKMTKEDGSECDLEDYSHLTVTAQTPAGAEKIGGVEIDADNQKVVASKPGSITIAATIDGNDDSLETDSEGCFEDLTIMALPAESALVDVEETEMDSFVRVGESIEVKFTTEPEEAAEKAEVTVDSDGLIAEKVNGKWFLRGVKVDEAAIFSITFPEGCGYEVDADSKNDAEGIIAVVPGKVTSDPAADADGAISTSVGSKVTFASAGAPKLVVTTNDEERIVDNPYVFDFTEAGTLDIIIQVADANDKAYGDEYDLSKFYTLTVSEVQFAEMSDHLDVEKFHITNQYKKYEYEESNTGVKYLAKAYRSNGIQINSNSSSTGCKSGVISSDNPNKYTISKVILTKTSVNGVPKISFANQAAEFTDPKSDNDNDYGVISYPESDNNIILVPKADDDNNDDNDDKVNGDVVVDGNTYTFTPKGEFTYFCLQTNTDKALQMSDIEIVYNVPVSNPLRFAEKSSTHYLHAPEGFDMTLGLRNDKEDCPVKLTSSNTRVAAISEDGKTVVPGHIGTAVITATTTYLGKEFTATHTLTVDTEKVEEGKLSVPAIYYTGDKLVIEKDPTLEGDYIIIEHQDGVTINLDYTAGEESSEAKPGQTNMPMRVADETPTAEELTEDLSVDGEYTAKKFYLYGKDNYNNWRGGTLKVSAEKDDMKSDTREVTISIPTGVDGVMIESEGGAEYFTLQGVRVAEPQAGEVYIRVVAGKAAKIVK